MKTSLTTVKQPKRFDFALLIILLLFMGVSMLAIYCAFPQMQSSLNPPRLLLLQFAFYILGFIVIALIMYLGNDSIYDFAVLGYKILIVMLAYLFVSSIYYNFTGGSLPLVSCVNGASSWFDFYIVSFQPSEFMKIVLVIITAHIIQEHNEDKQQDSFASDIELFIKVLKWVLPPVIMILAQPDTGMCIIIGISILLMLACGGIRKEWTIIGSILIVVVVAGFLILYFYFNDTFLSLFGGDDISTINYRFRRIYGWLDVETYSSSYGLQLYKALLAIGGGGWFGYGIQSSIISIPEPHTDFIFAVIGLCLGFVGCIIVIALCLALDIRLAIIAHRTNDMNEKLFIIGFLGILLYQQIQNIGMVIGLLPITGITLPLISYGGSSLLSYMIGFGIVMNASLKAKKLSDYVYSS